MTVEKILLIGMMGAGKTSVGRALTARTGWPYRDNDETVAMLTGLPTRRAARAPRHRRAAHRRVAWRCAPRWPRTRRWWPGSPAAWSSRPRTWPRCAAPTPSSSTCTRPSTCWCERVGDGAGRPWLQPDPETALRTLFAGREPLYREVADVVVDTSTGDADAHADQVVQALASGCRREGRRPTTRTMRWRSGRCAGSGLGCGGGRAR